MTENEASALEASARLYDAIPGYVLATSDNGNKDKDRINHLIVDLIDALDDIEFSRNGEALFNILGEALGNRKKAILKIQSEFGLTKREAHILRYLANDRNPTYIARELGISQATAKSHKYSIFKKLGIHSTAELKELLKEYSK